MTILSSVSLLNNASSPLREFPISLVIALHIALPAYLGENQRNAPSAYSSSTRTLGMLTTEAIWRQFA